MGSHQIASSFSDRDREAVRGQRAQHQPSFMTGRGSGLPAPQQHLACLSPWSPSPLGSVAQSGGLRRSEAEMAQSNGGWRRGGGRRAQKNPIKGTRLINTSNNKEGLKASPQSPFPVSAEQWQEECVDPSMKAARSPTRRRAWGSGPESQPARRAEVVGQPPLGDLGTHSPWEPILGSSHPSSGWDLGDLLRVLPSQGSAPLSPSTGDFALDGLRTPSLSLFFITIMRPAILTPTINCSNPPLPGCFLWLAGCLSFYVNYVS